MVGSSLQLFCVWYQGLRHNGSQLVRLPRWLLLGNHEPNFGLVAALGVVPGEQGRATQWSWRRRSARSPLPPETQTCPISVWWSEWTFRVLSGWSTRSIFSTPEQTGSLRTEGRGGSFTSPTNGGVDRLGPFHQAATCEKCCACLGCCCRRHRSSSSPTSDTISGCFSACLLGRPQWCDTGGHRVLPATGTRPRSRPQSERPRPPVPGRRRPHPA